MPRPRGADAAGLLLRELELHPPAEEWHRRNMFGGPWSDPEDLCPLDGGASGQSAAADPHGLNSSITFEGYNGGQCIWPRKRRLSEREAAFGLKTSLGLGSYLGIMGSRRDVVTAVWKTGLDGVWYKVRYPLRSHPELALMADAEPLLSVSSSCFLWRSASGACGRRRRLRHRGARAPPRTSARRGGSAGGPTGVLCAAEAGSALSSAGGKLHGLLPWQSLG